MYVYIRCIRLYALKRKTRTKKGGPEKNEKYKNANFDLEPK